MTLDKKIRVGIRGMSGLLGSRLALAIRKNADMVLSAGIVRNDETLNRVLHGPQKHSIWAEHMYLDEAHRVVYELNNSQSLVEFEPADQLNLSKICDIVVDTTPPKSRPEKWNQKYKHFKKPVILQSGEYPNGRLITPPLIEEIKEESNIYRQGDCILSALSPILASLESVISGFRVHFLMQYGESLHDYPTSQRINSTYLRDDLALQIQDELNSLFREKEIVVEGLLQVPGLDYYTLTLHVNTNIPLNGKDLKSMLEQRPRVMVAPEGISSTYEIDHFLREESKAIGKDIPPIVIYNSDLKDSESKTEHRIRATVYSRMIAVLPNIDSIRILAKGQNPLEAMEITDKSLGFNYK